MATELLSADRFSTSMHSGVALIVDLSRIFSAQGGELAESVFGAAPSWWSMWRSIEAKRKRQSHLRTLALT